MKIHARLRRLAAAAPPPAGPGMPHSVRWLRCLQLVAAWKEDTSREAPDETAAAARAVAAPLRAAVGLLRRYVASGRTAPRTEAHCGAACARFAAWYYARIGDPWHGVPCPVTDEAQQLRACLALDRG